MQICRVGKLGCIGVLMSELCGSLVAGEAVSYSLDR